MAIKCPDCGSNTDVVDSRTMEGNIQRRRHWCRSNKSHRFTTMEVIIPGNKITSDKSFLNILLQTIDTYLRDKVVGKRPLTDE